MVFVAVRIPVMSILAVYINGSSPRKMDKPLDVEEVWQIVVSTPAFLSLLAVIRKSSKVGLGTFVAKKERRA